MNVDWAALIARLERRMRHVDIAAAIDRHPNYPGNLKRGLIKEPPFSVGCILIALDENPDCTIPQYLVSTPESTEV